MRFYYVQRGKFNEDGNSLYGTDGVVTLDNMRIYEFENGSIQKSYKRIMHDFNNYVYTPTGIYTKDNDELIVFSNQEQASAIKDSLISFINNPFPIKDYSELEKIPNSSINDDEYTKLMTNFWWCIEMNKDWMAFLNSNKELFENGINNDYNNWWLKKSKSERKKEYVKSLRIY